MRRWIAGMMTSLAGCSAVPAVPGAQPAPAAVEWQVVRESARNGATPEALGLSGANKPNGTQYRLRVSVPTRATVPRMLDSLQLTIADSTREGWFTLYRTPPTGLGPNGAFRAVLYDLDGRVRWSVDLHELLSRPTHLEVQDIRYGGAGALYLNEACQSYAREAGGACSSLLRIDPLTRTAVWRTRPLVSNNILLVHGRYVIAGYGFTAEPDSLHAVDAATGRIVASLGLDSAHQYLEWQGDVLHVLTTNRIYQLRLRER